MKRTFTLLVASFFSYALSFAQTPVTLTYSHSQDITNALACTTGDTQMYRYFILSDFMELAGGTFTLEELEFAITTNANAVGVPAEISIFKSTSMSFPLDWPANYELLYTTSYTPSANDLGTIVSVEIEDVVNIPDSHGLVVMFNWNLAFWVGDNDLGEDRPTYISSENCGLGSPETTEGVGFPAYAVINLIGTANTLGLEDFTGVNVSVYPNPAKDNLSISAGNNNIESVVIRNIQGGIVTNIVVGATTVDINVSNYATGVYMIEIQSENGKSVQKFVKK